MSSTDPKSGPAPVVRVDDVTVAYRSGTVALEGVSLTLDRPSICGLVGMNGAGKSTLFKTIMGFVEPTRGKVSIGGRPVSAAQKENIVAYVPQAEEVDWTFPVSVADVVMMGRQGRMGFLRMPGGTDRRLVAESLARVGMADFADRQIGELSGGQRKRVFLARALAQQASILLLDEPFTGVDVRTEEAIIAILRDLRAGGAIVLVSTHDLATVPAFCDSVAMVNRRLVAFGPVATTFTEANLSRAFGGTLHRFLPGHGLPAGPDAAAARGLALGAAG
ncbi:metal ABC transporter ATP-binding protein [Methylobrevis albus]|uniref:Metal ABC transporter ATP-binding protein n=1 Tax=Methylobrevis albus TaxID=2793297 RepID=A0A931I1V7_9HYPH|nr:metal ABC transporter ATP-binding protein [Methylobrevis albus]MBH0237869.1 metal ABC transporter ATP-binding protein [Methylobrevis albus]